MKENKSLAWKERWQPYGWRRGRQSNAEGVGLTSAVILIYLGTSRAVWAPLSHFVTALLSGEPILPRLKGEVAQHKLWRRGIPFFTLPTYFFNILKICIFNFMRQFFACFCNIYFDLCCLNFEFQKKLKNFSKINIKYQVKIQILKSVNFELFLNYLLTSV